MAPLERLLQHLGYQFNSPQLLEQALTHRSANALNNERLEFLGDALLGFITAELLFTRYADADEGQLSRLRARLVKRESLAALAKSINLGDHLNLGIGEIRSGGYARDSILADAMEAVLAAVYLDGGMVVVVQLVSRLLGERLGIDTLDSGLKDPKTLLQELMQSRGLALPEYGVLEVWGNQHEQSFRVFCRIPGDGVVTEGSAGSRRRAEQQAAQLMLEQMHVVDLS